ncbi:MAG: hypothetical protein OEZ43_03565 [Gammaproteobacteria bacterium]|nr:hypothetical protein [Gammaproteobacteria bacterium]
MFKKSVLLVGLLLGMASVSSAVLACGGANSGKHIGNITAVDANNKTFTIRDMESSNAITFKAGSDIMAALNGASGHVMVNYEENDEGALVAVGVTF